jgi:hypothetical protein
MFMPLAPAPSLGQILSSAAGPVGGVPPGQIGPEFADAAGAPSALEPPSEPPAPHAAEPTRVPAAPAASGIAVPEPIEKAVDDSAEDSAYTLVAPVEIHFTDGGVWVGVKAGTRTHDEFQRLASLLLTDLRKARGW